jgi:hypothetical protein
MTRPSKCDVAFIKKRSPAIVHSVDLKKLLAEHIQGSNFISSLARFFAFNLQPFFTSQNKSEIIIYVSSNCLDLFLTLRRSLPSFLMEE